MSEAEGKKLTMVQMSKSGRAILKEIAARLQIKMPEAADLIVRAWEEKQHEEVAANSEEK